LKEVEDIDEMISENSINSSNNDYMLKDNEFEESLK
jgi:hypothetical protein